MTDWKEMYLTMVRASEEAVRILVEAQRTCEELYLRAGEDGETNGETAEDGQRGSLCQSSST